MAAPLAIATKAIGTRVLAQAAVKTATKKNNNFCNRQNNANS